MARRRRGSGEGTVYKRADGSWAAALDLGVVEGKRRRRFVYGRTQKEVLDKLALLRRQQTSGARLMPPRLTVGQYLDHWLHTTLPGSVRPSTEANYATLTR